MIKREPLTVARAREAIAFNPETGALRNRVHRGTRARAGAIAGRLQTLPSGLQYYRLEIDGVQYRGHHIAWLNFYGKWPNGDLDHIDGCGTNNRN